MEVTSKEVKAIWAGHDFIRKLQQVYFPVGIYLFKFNNRNNQNNGHFGVFIVNFEQISHTGASFVDLE